MKKHVWKWLIKHGRSSYIYIILLTVASILSSVISIQFSLESKRIIDAATGVSGESFISACVGIVIFLVLRLLISIAINFINVHGSSKFEISLKDYIFRLLLEKDYLSVAAFHSGELLNRINNDVNVIVSGIITIIPQFAMFFTSIVGAFICLYRMDSTLALIILAIGPFVMIGARLYSRKYKILHKRTQEANGRTNSFMLEILQNLLVIKSFDNEDSVIEKENALQKARYRLKVIQTKVSVVAHVGMFVIFNAGFYFALAYCAYRLSQGAMTYGDVMAITQLVSQVQAPFRNMSGLVPQLFSVIASAERLMELEEIKPEIRTGSRIGPEMYNEIDEIVFDNVRFSYTADSVVSGINMRIKRGEFAVVAGESGAGKSTAIKLLLGIFSPESGRIYIRLKNGELIDIGNNSRKLFAYVPQGNLILSGTIRENITFANEAFSEEDVIKAAKIAQIWDYIKTLDEGLDTVIGEKGLGLSEGQAQRISIARAIMYGAPILLLDESTSALDSKTEEELLRSLKSMTDKTVIIVSHKQAAFDFCDKVVYVEKETNGKNEEDI